MDIQQIRYFLEVAKHKSFSKAAEKLFVTQPVLTRCVKGLEQELGVFLILRSTKTFALTDAGETLVRYGTNLLQQHQDIYRRIQDVSDAQVGEILISCPGTLLDLYFPKLMNQYRKDHPGIHISVRERGSMDVEQDILDGVADIGVVMLPLKREDALHIYPVVQDEIQVVVRRGHPLENLPEVHISQLKGLDIITYDTTTTLNNMFCTLCRENGFAPSLAFQSMMPGFILDTIASSDCVGVLPAPLTKRAGRDDLVGIPLRPFLPWNIAVITKKDRYLSSAAAHFLGFCQENLSNDKQ